MVSENSPVIKGTHEGSLVYRFITAGNPGICVLCKQHVQKLEAHHLSYEPEVIIKICHACHHKVHFWPTRLTEFELFTLLEKLTDSSTAVKLSKLKLLNNSSLAKLIAPSRNAFIHSQQVVHDKIDKRANKIISQPKPKPLTSLSLKVSPVRILKIRKVKNK